MQNKNDASAGAQYFLIFANLLQSLYHPLCIYSLSTIRHVSFLKHGAFRRLPETSTDFVGRGQPAYTPVGPSVNQLDNYRMVVEKCDDTDARGNAKPNTKRSRVARTDLHNRRDWRTDSSRTTNVCRSLALSVGRSPLMSYHKHTKPTRLPDLAIIFSSSPTLTEAQSRIYIRGFLGIRVWRIRDIYYPEAFVVVVYVRNISNILYSVRRTKGLY